MYAIIESGGKQYKVEEGHEIKVERIEGKKGDRLILDKVLLISKDENCFLGKPYLKKAQVEAQIRRHGKEKKILVFKYKPKKRYRKKMGHRQYFTTLLIEKIHYDKDEEVK